MLRTIWRGYFAGVVLWLLAFGTASALRAAGTDQIEGTLTVTVVDYFKQHRSETKYSIDDSQGRRFEVSFEKKPLVGLATGMRVKVRGTIRGGRLEQAEVLDKPLAVTAGADFPVTTPSSGVQNTVVFNLVSDAAGASGANFTNAQLATVLFGATGLSVNTLYLENSFNAVSFAGDVFGPYAITIPSSCDTNDVTTKAEAAATAAGVNFSGYAHRVYMLPDEMVAHCTFGGLSTIGGSPSHSWINTGDYGPADSNIDAVVAHELGHALRMNHAQSINADGSLKEYGDNSCIMGNSYVFSDFNAVHRMQEGWLPLSNVQQVTAPGTYTVSLAENQTSAVQVLQVALPGTAGNLYVSYRQPIGRDRNLSGAFLAGASIHYWDGGSNRTQLATDYPWGGALFDGATFLAVDGIVSIRQVTHDGNTVTVEVKANDSVEVSAASFVGGTLAAESISTAFGTDLATAIGVAATVPLPLSLQGTTVTVTDATGVAKQAPLYFVSPGQVNYEMPAGLALGEAAVTIQSGDGKVSHGAAQIEAVSPGLFQVNTAGLVAGNILRVRPDGSTGYEQVFQADASGTVTPVGVDLSAAQDQVFVILYGTGLRGAGTDGVSVQVGGVDAPVAYAGPQGSLVGLDQVNALLPNSMAGGGMLPIVLAANGVQANTGAILIGGKPGPPVLPTVMASDDFNVPPYALGALSGQEASGTGFAGPWFQVYRQDLAVTAPGVIGRAAGVTGTAGDCMGFKTPLTLAGQMFIGVNITNPLGTNLNSSRLDLDSFDGSVAFLGAMGSGANFNFSVGDSSGTEAIAQTSIPSIGSHRLVGVLDSLSKQIAIFVDPTPQSFYNANGVNNADAVSPWSPGGMPQFPGYCLVDNLGDQAGFSHVAFAVNAAASTVVQ